MVEWASAQHFWVACTSKSPRNVTDARGHVWWQHEDDAPRISDVVPSCWYRPIRLARIAEMCESTDLCQRVCGDDISLEFCRPDFNRVVCTLRKFPTMVACVQARIHARVCGEHLLFVAKHALSL